MDVSMTIPMNNPMNTQKAKVISDINKNPHYSDYNIILRLLKDSE